MNPRWAGGPDVLFSCALQLAALAGCSPDAGAPFFASLIGLDGATRREILADLIQFLIGSRTAGERLVWRLSVLDTLRPDLTLRVQCAAMLASVEATP